jgi:hypothetical protein
MKLPRKYRILTALIALFSMLFMQTAVASYACPRLQTDHAPDSMVADQASGPAMPGCDQPDPASPALCHAHCLDAKASQDKPSAPIVSPAVVLVSTLLLPLEPLRPLAQPVADQPSLLQRITAPPIAIRHCCFRI